MSLNHGNNKPVYSINTCMCLCYTSTWSGPAWSPAGSLSSVLISIQSLMNEKPYHNEPGFEQVRDELWQDFNPIINVSGTSLSYDYDDVSILELLIKSPFIQVPTCLVCG